MPREERKKRFACTNMVTRSPCPLIEKAEKRSQRGRVASVSLQDIATSSVLQNVFLRGFQGEFSLTLKT